MNKLVHVHNLPIIDISISQFAIIQVQRFQGLVNVGRSSRESFVEGSQGRDVFKVESLNELLDQILRGLNLKELQDQTEKFGGLPIPPKGRSYARQRARLFQDIDGRQTKALFLPVPTIVDFLSRNVFHQVLRVRSVQERGQRVCHIRHGGSTTVEFVISL
jgi:hypothetical protein